MESEETLTKIESGNFKLQNDEYSLELTIYSDNSIVFKITQNSPAASCYYVEKFKIAKIPFLFCEKIEDAFQFYKNEIKNNKINIILSQDKNIVTIHYKAIVNNYFEKDVNLELKKKNLEKEDIINILRKEVEQNKKTIDELKKNIDFLMEEYNKKIKKEKEAEEKEKQLQKEEEELSSKNDNLNLINYFKCDKIQRLDKIEILTVNSGLENDTVVIYCMIKNNKRLYQMAILHNDSSKYFITFYDLVNKREVSQIYLGENISFSKLQHYYNPYKKKHMLLCSGSNNIQIWDISSNPMTPISNIQNANLYPCCLMFKDDQFSIYGVNSSNYNNITLDHCDQYGNRIESINIDSGCSFMETSYIDDKIYIIMDGCSKFNSVPVQDLVPPPYSVPVQDLVPRPYSVPNSNSYLLYYAQSYDVFQKTKINQYKNNNDNSSSQITCINFFNKGNKIDDIDLIVCKNNKIEFFSFKNKNLLKEILIDNLKFLCTINQKYIIIIASDKMKIIDNTYRFINDVECQMSSEYLDGLKKIKIPEIGEFIATFGGNRIKLWKLE